MKKIIQLILLIIVTNPSFGQKVQAIVASGSHLVLATNWVVFANSIISVEHLDGTNRHVYSQAPLNYNVNAMYVGGLDTDFAQNTPVLVYVVKPLIKIVSAPKINATVNSINQVISFGDWSKHSTGKILVEEEDGRNQHIYISASSRPYTSSSLSITNLNTDFAEGTIVNVYDIDYAVLSTEGNLSINTTSFDNQLSVNGKIRAQEVKVETANWPDYVFAKDHELQSLKETERHIKEKGHLPGIPSAAEVKANGIDLGEMNAKLLQKIEELTLHLIKMRKELDELKKK
ncbi:hypothetical protein [Pedobacter hiemivivus]|uniref:Cell wall anchor protein n=1 Tax=Pedobacter hiemivivus TaxID=2530454 RepID=A0A4R0NBQ4_9SPHI|nr:hypothetical protein [Pedobacter hiemivivus]TCC97700.1 hypothetical protein EZ444_07225 [Pedobacter hiemivivus]